VGRKLDGTQAV